jgi:hypothetical protein
MDTEMNLKNKSGTIMTGLIWLRRRLSERGNKHFGSNTRRGI